MALTESKVLLLAQLFRVQLRRSIIRNIRHTSPARVHYQVQSPKPRFPQTKQAHGKYDRGYCSRIRAMYRDAAHPVLPGPLQY